MKYMNIAFRVPPPKAFYRSGFVSVVPPFKGAVIHYTTDAGLPTGQSPVYRDSIRTNTPDSLRFRTVYNQSLASIAITPIRIPIGTWKMPGQSAMIQNTWDLAPVFNQAGSWDITFTPDSLNNTFLIGQVALFENGYKVASAHFQNVVDGKWHYRLEVPAYDATKVYSLRAEIKTASPSGGFVQMQLLPYLTPTTGVIVNMPLENHDALSLTDYNFSTTVSCRGNAKAGDALTFVFASPLICKRIISVTGMPMLSLFPIKHGHLEVSYDGVHFEYVSAYHDGSASIEPIHPVKAVRIVIDAPTEDPEMVIQGLRIN
jgi:hexosaminidase